MVDAAKPIEGAIIPALQDDYLDTFLYSDDEDL